MLSNFDDHMEISSAHDHYEGRYGQFQSYDNHHAVINHLKNVAHNSAPRAYRRVNKYINVFSWRYIVHTRITIYYYCYYYVWGPRTFPLA